MQPRFGPGFDNPLRFLSVIFPEALQLLVVRELFSGATNRLERAVLRKDLGRFRNQCLAIGSELASAVDSHGTAYAVAEGGESPKPELLPKDGEVSLRFISDEIAWHQLVGPWVRSSESKSIVGDYRASCSCAQFGRKAAPQFDASQGIVKKQDWRCRLRLSRSACRSPYSSEDATLRMANPNVVRKSAEHYARNPLRCLRQTEFFPSTQGVMLLGNREARPCERIADQPIRVKVHLPVVLVVAVRTHGENCSHRVER